MKTKTLLVLCVSLLTIFCLPEHSFAKGGGGRASYAWEPKTPEDKIMEYLRVGPRKESDGWSAFASCVMYEAQNVKNINPELKEKLLKHAEAALEQLKRSENKSEIDALSRAIIFYREKISFNFNVEKLKHERLVITGKDMINVVTKNCEKAKKEGKTNYVDNEYQVRKFALRDISEILDAGVGLKEIGVSSVEEMRDRADCRK